MKKFPLLLFLFFINSLSITAQSASDHFQYAESYFSQRKYIEAINSYSRAINLQPSNAAYHNRAVAKLETYDYTGAIEDLSQAIRLNPGNRLHYHVRAAAYNLLEDHEKAIQDYSSMIKLDPKDFEAYELRAGRLLIAERNKEAAKDFTFLIKNKGSDDIAYRYWQRGRAYFGMREFRKALSDFNTTLKMKPEYWDLYLERAEAYYELKDFKNACADLKQASEHGYESVKLESRMGCN